MPCENPASSATTGADQPAEGRFDGENSNFGIVTIDDRVYEDLAQTMASVNREAEQLHASAP
jgi:hypothetical protein